MSKVKPQLPPRPGRKVSIPPKTNGHSTTSQQLNHTVVQKTNVSSVQKPTAELGTKKTTPNVVQKPTNGTLSQKPNVVKAADPKLPTATDIQAGRSVKDLIKGFQQMKTTPVNMPPQRKPSVIKTNQQGSPNRKPWEKNSPPVKPVVTEKPVKPVIPVKPAIPVNQIVKQVVQQQISTEQQAVVQKSVQEKSDSSPSSLQTPTVVAPKPRPPVPAFKPKRKLSEKKLEESNNNEPVVTQEIPSISVDKVPDEKAAISSKKIPPPVPSMKPRKYSAPPSQEPVKTRPPVPEIKRKASLPPTAPPNNVQQPTESAPPVRVRPPVPIIDPSKFMKKQAPKSAEDEIDKIKEGLLKLQKAQAELANKKRIKREKKILNLAKDDNALTISVGQGTDKKPAEKPQGGVRIVEKNKWTTRMPDVTEAVKKMGSAQRIAYTMKLEKFFEYRYTVYQNKRPETKWYKPSEEELKRIRQQKQEDIKAEIQSEKIREVDLTVIKIFGYSIDEVMQRKHETGEIPLLVDKMLSFIEQKTQNEDRIKSVFQVQPSHEEMDRLKETFDKNLKANFEKENIHVVAGLFKRYLMTLPDSLLPAKHYTECIKIAEIYDQTKRENRMKELIQQLPKPNQIILERLLKILYRCVVYGKTPSGNLAIMFAIALLRPGEDEPKETQLKNSKKIAILVNAMIKSYPMLFNKEQEASYDDSNFVNDDQIFTSRKQIVLSNKKKPEKSKPLPVISLGLGLGESVEEQIVCHGYMLKKAAHRKRWDTVYLALRTDKLMLYSCLEKFKAGKSPKSSLFMVYAVVEYEATEERFFIHCLHKLIVVGRTCFPCTAEEELCILMQKMKSV